MGAVSSVKMVLTVGDNPSWAARAHRIEHVEEANDWLTTGSRGTGFMDNKFDPLAGVIQTPQHEADTPGSSVPKLDLTKLAATGTSLSITNLHEITIDDNLPKASERDLTIEDFPMPSFQNVDIPHFKAPEKEAAANNPYYTVEAEPSGKLDLYKQQGWQWPPPAGHVGSDPAAPAMGKGMAEARKHDTLDTIDAVNKESLAVIDNVAQDLQVMALTALNEQAAMEVAHVELSVTEDQEKLKALAEMRRCLLSTVNNQVDKQKHQWGVKSKFYQSDVESKRIFEEVQERISTESRRRMDQAKKEVAEQLVEHSQSLMEAKKGEIFGRVDSWYETARATSKEESAQLFVVQQQQKDALRAEFVARMKDHTKRMQAEEFKKAVDKAKSINIRINLDDEFKAYCQKRGV